MIRVSLQLVSRAHRLVKRAKERGELIPQPCAVCRTSRQVVAHHENYERPLEVVWLCKSHHRLRHSEIGDALVSPPALRVPDVPDELKAQLKAEAALAGKTLVEYVVDVLKARKTKA